MKRLEFGRAAGPTTLSHCAGCLREMTSGPSIYCLPCRIAAGSGSRVDASGGTWIQDGRDYQRGAETTGSGASRQHVKGESLLFTRFHLRPREQWLPLEVSLMPGCFGPHGWYIAFLARSPLGRARLTPRQLAWHEARISQKPRSKRPKPPQRPQDRRAYQHEARTSAEVRA